MILEIHLPTIRIQNEVGRRFITALNVLGMPASFKSVRDDRCCIHGMIVPLFYIFIVETKIISYPSQWLAIELTHDFGAISLLSTGVWGRHLVEH